MLNHALKPIKTACVFLLLMTLFCGLIYPLFITGIAQGLFPTQANGSLIKQKDQTVGSRWIGQSFSSPEFFHGRPSTTKSYPYNALYSSGSNLSPANPLLLQTITDRANNIKRQNPANNLSIPMELVTASASGLDPDISPFSALFQVSRIAKARGIAEKDLNALIEKNKILPFLGIIGQPRVNVLALNLALLTVETSQKPFNNTGNRYE